MAKKSLMIAKQAATMLACVLCSVHLYTGLLSGGACDTTSRTGNKKIDGTLCIGGSLIQKSCPPRAMFPLGSPRKHQKSYTGRIKLASRITGQQQDPIAIAPFFDIPLFLNVTAQADDIPSFITVDNISIGNTALAIEGNNAPNTAQDNGIAAAQIILDIGYECSPFACPPIVELNLEYGPEAPIDTFRINLAPGSNQPQNGNVANWFSIQPITIEITETRARIALLLYVILFTGHDLTASEVNNFNTFLDDTINRLSIAIALTGTYEPGSRSCSVC